MQAGLTQQRLTFRDVFTPIPNFLCLVRTVCVFLFHANSPGREDSAISEAAQQHLITEAPRASGSKVILGAMYLTFWLQLPVGKIM